MEYIQKELLYIGVTISWPFSGLINNSNCNIMEYIVKYIQEELLNNVSVCKCAFYPLPLPPPFFYPQYWNTIFSHIGMGYSMCI